MDEKLFELAFELAVYLLPILTAAVIKFIFNKIGTERILKIRQEFDVKYAWAWDVVLSAQRKYWKETGSYRYQKATQALAAKARLYKVPITAEEIDILIDAAVEAMKKLPSEILTHEVGSEDFAEEEPG